MLLVVAFVRVMFCLFTVSELRVVFFHGDERAVLQLLPGTVTASGLFTT